MPAFHPHTLDHPDEPGRLAMTASKVKRKLTTILCADVRGYSSLMGVAETETLERLKRYRAIMNELFERHDGRKVNTWGDAVIAEFPSVVEAVRCGVEIQDAISAENRDLPKNEQMWFRIGINLGDVMQDGTDLYGDGVNVAARLESLADPGGIMVSDTVYNLTHKQLSFAYDFAGEQTVKGLDQPIVGYRVRMPGQNAADAADLLDRIDLDAIDPEPGVTAARRPAPTAQTAANRVRRSDARDDLPSVRRGPLGRLRDWYFSQSRLVRMPVAMIALFFIINLFTDGLRTIWFIYPAMPFVAIIVVSYLAGVFGHEKKS